MPLHSSHSALSPVYFSRFYILRMPGERVRAGAATFVVEVELGVERGRGVQLVLVAEVAQELVGDVGFAVLVVLDFCLFPAQDSSH